VFESNEIHLFGIFFLVFFSYSCENQLDFHYADVNHQDAAPRYFQYASAGGRYQGSQLGMRPQVTLLSIRIGWWALSGVAARYAAAGHATFNTHRLVGGIRGRSSVCGRRSQAARIRQTNSIVYVL